MKKIILTIILILAFPAVALGYGIGTGNMSDYPNAIDFREYQIAEDMNSILHPISRFEIEVGGERQISSDTAYIIPAQDNTTIRANVGGRIAIFDQSTPGSGKKIAKYDIQYRFTPAGKNREDYMIQANIVSNWAQVKNIIEGLELAEPGELEIYLAVADDDQCLPGAENWSTNGNVRTLNTTNPNFPGGIFWYFTGLTVQVVGSGIDLAVTTENNSYSEVPGVPVKVKVEFDFSRLDTQTMPIDAVFTWTGAATGSQTLTVYSDEALDLALADTTTDDEWNAVYDKAFENSFYYVYFTGYANNTYTVTGTIMPTEGTDIDLSNNTATATIVIYPNTAGTDIPDAEIEPEIMVNITG